MILFAVLTIIYFRYAIWSPTDALLTKHLATDIYVHFVHAWGSLKMLGQGFVPIGDYWVQRGGGYPAALYDQLTHPQDFLLMVVYALTGSLTAALKFVVIASYSATLVTAYWLGMVLFKRRDASVILAVAYTFSVYGANQLEHLALLCTQPFILLTLIFLEKTFQNGKLSYIVLTSLGLLSVWLSHPYSFYFLIVFVGFRIAFQLLTTQHRMEMLRRTSKVGVLSLLTLTPFLLLQLLKLPSEQFVEATLKQGLFVYSQPPLLYFLRNTPYELYVTEIYFMYLGLSVLMLALIPMILKHAQRSLYTFYLLVTAFFMLYSVGQHGPVNLALWFQEHMPFALFIRVPGRALIMGYLSLAVCAAIGFSVLIDKVKQLRWKPILTLLVVLIIFADLTIGFEPSTMTVPPTTEGTYEFLKEQPGDFRIVEVPSIHGQQAMTDIYTEHDTINFALWAFGHFDPLYAFAEVYNDYANLNVTAQEASFYGVKYVTVNTDPQYFVTFRKALLAVGGPTLTQVQRVEDWLSESADYKLVYSERYTNVYENLMYRGIVFSDGTDCLSWVCKDSNTLLITYSSTKPTTITVSQSFADGWVATLEPSAERLPIRNVDSIQQIEVPAGSHSIVLHYQSYERWFIILAAFYTVFAITVSWMYYRRERR